MMPEDRRYYKDRIKKDFKVYPPSEADKICFMEIRRASKALAHLIEETCPPGRELSIALTKLEEAMFWANAGIARS
jgi:hypothetical protein